MKTQKDKVLNLFGFLMDLIEEPQEIKEEVKEDLKEEIKVEVKVLTNPTLPYHPIMNPYTLGSIREADNKKSADKYSSLKCAIPKGIDLMNKMDLIDKRHYDEVDKTRIVKKAVKPLISEIEDLKAKAHKGAMEDKETEEISDIMDTVGGKLGVTVENGKVKLVDLPSKLRDNIPLGQKPIQSLVGISINDDKTEIKGVDDLPKDIRDKLDADGLLESKLQTEHSIGDNLVEAILDGEKLFKPKSKAKAKPKAKAKAKTKKK